MLLVYIWSRGEAFKCYSQIWRWQITQKHLYSICTAGNWDFLVVCKGKEHPWSDDVIGGDYHLQYHFSMVFSSLIVFEITSGMCYFCLVTSSYCSTEWQQAMEVRDVRSPTSMGNCHPIYIFIHIYIFIYMGFICVFKHHLLKLCFILQEWARTQEE